MKKIVLFMIFAGIAGIAKAQGDTTVVQTTVDTTIIVRETTTVSTSVNTDNASSSNVLSDFLSYMAYKKKQKRASAYFAGNHEWHCEPYFGFGFVVGDIQHNDARLLYGQSYSIDFGLKWRYQFTRTYSWTINTGFMHNRYRIADGFANEILGFQFPTGDIRDYNVYDERFRTWGIGISYGNRFNFGRRHSDCIGKYVELSVYGNYAYSRKYMLSYDGPNHASGEQKYDNPDMYVPFEAGAQVNIGLGWFSIWGRYRITDWFYARNTPAELPKFVVGFAINL